MNNKKQSILAGGLISSAGILISKFLGLLYVIPYDTILQTAQNRVYYANAYNIYSYVLNIATAGLPFAIATLIARYASRNDYRTCLMVKKISFYTMAAFGFICMCAMILFSPMIAEQIVPDEGSYNIMRNVVILMSLAVFIIPILSSMRGFYQGFKEMEIYSTSQVIEQITRIIFLLGAGALAVYVFHKDAIWAVYFGVIAASVAGLLTILYIKSYDRTKLKVIKRKAKEQEHQLNIAPYELFKELVFVAIPFLLIAVFGYCDTIINQMDIVPGLKAFGVAKKEITLLQDAIFFKANKLIAIPMILAPGFSSAIIPYITTALEQKNRGLVKKYILDCVESVIYIALPICFALFVFAKPIIFTLFGVSGNNINLYADVLRWFSLEALCATVCPIFSTLVMALGSRRKIVLNTAIFAIVKVAINRLLISYLGMPGMVLSSFIAYAIFAILNIWVIQKSYNVNWKYTFRKIIFMLAGLVGFYLFAKVFGFIGMLDYSGSRFISLIYLGIMGIVCCLVYLVITGYCNIPQSIFDINLKQIVQKFSKRGRHK
ncbi:O-antigen/teichoic acid export membrane protein [Breznakia sp. PF5-3]|uniref:oligosaccharide flippase family protein n=1 Tax=unclassified Breznakia TaxID=2623764 RepID=UPI002404EB67|nr:MULTISPECIES: oligosaccharide flippase family protein [unclassified Breznakia]MDF9823890.1 O-antigen/teichoic acid export membrane protein [Breznakia sp. PM6-1]MDF9834689.1 O-antigen/teichoic acid export membrane protein [Breznakia sp. PF5-3]MDF9836876.1 O-antigen/teichoic acid export membrane protein [Breznakia sp. PFB2-8]MDF9858893.1 O-antigen/teichoic acid export membrane protein [Breznakia sp. PH5-24]